MLFTYAGKMEKYVKDIGAYNNCQARFKNREFDSRARLTKAPVNSSIVLLDARQKSKIYKI